MANFITRVVLHKDDKSYESLDSETYDLLHREMEKKGFSRTIIGTKNIEYHLPPAEYNKTGDFTIEEIRTSAQNIAKKASKKYSILVTEGNCAWSNLEKVK